MVFFGKALSHYTNDYSVISALMRKYRHTDTNTSQVTDWQTELIPPPPNKEGRGWVCGHTNTSQVTDGIRSNAKTSKAW